MIRFFQTGGLVLLVLTSVLLAGCAAPLRGEITTFHQWPVEAPRAVQLVRTAEQRNSLAHDRYEEALHGELVRAGFRIAPDARFALSFAYRVTRHFGATIEYQPLIQPYFWWGSFGPHMGMMIGGPFPWWGAYPVASNRIWYDYRLQVWIEDRSVQPAHRVYEASAIADSFVPEADEVLPLLARALFTDFPGTHGATRRVSVPRAHQGEPQ